MRASTRPERDLDIARGEQTPHRAAIAPAESEHAQAALVCCCERAVHVLRVAGGRDRQQHVAGRAEYPHLFCIDLGVGIVVGDRVKVELSVVSAIAASPGRSRSKRLTSSEEKCWESAAEPPLPQDRTCIRHAAHSRAWRRARDRRRERERSALLDLDAGSEQRLHALFGLMSLLIRCSRKHFQARNASRIHSMRSPPPPSATTSKRTGARASSGRDWRKCCAHAMRRPCFLKSTVSAGVPCALSAR